MTAWFAIEHHSGFDTGLQWTVNSGTLSLVEKQGKGWRGAGVKEKEGGGGKKRGKVWRVGGLFQQRMRLCVRSMIMVA